MRSWLIAVALGLVAASGCDGHIVEGQEGRRGDPGLDGPDAGTIDDDPLAPDAGPNWEDGSTLADRDCPDDSLVTYRNFGSAFLSAYCNGCHSSQVPMGMRQGAPMGVDFDSLDGVRDFADRIYARAGDGYTTMPPAGSPQPDDRVLLGEWLSCGAPAE